MPEPRELSNARQCLARAEAEYRSEDGLTRLTEGLALLDEVIAGESAQHARTARNLASTYAARIYGRIKSLVETDRALPEPELEHFFKLVLAFDQVGGELPKSAKALKIGVVRQLIERYYEGHPAERKQQALRELEQLSGRD
jgi:hypothetical protein